MDVETARETIAAEAPRRLRLTELLCELGACEDAEPPPLRTANLTVGALVDKAAEGGFGFLIGVLALIAIPFVGLSTPFGLAIALLGGQLMIGRRQPWLPGRARRRPLTMTMLDRVLRLLARRTRWLARLSRRRWELVIQPRLIGLGIVLLALGLALPLPIPGSNLMFLIPLFMYSVGVLERDGLWIVLGYVGTLIDMALLLVFGATVVAVLERIWHWLT
ncbi:MAG TPA: exopolysaccharide biosynthesis protein [Kofleriaceae bacterium]|nr:exopolysaccharide biosynthesis protein [Kofleriaceae bacterium]